MIRDECDVYLQFLIVTVFYTAYSFNSVVPCVFKVNCVYGWSLEEVEWENHTPMYNPNIFPLR